MNIVTTLKTMPDFYSLSGSPESAVQEAERTLGLSFASEYREYLSSLSLVSFCGHELTGLVSSPRLNVVSATERLRNRHIPSDYYVIEETNIDGIVIWQNSTGAIFQTAPGQAPVHIYDSLCEYISAS